MITFDKLASNGRLGNQMFQYALLLGIENKFGYRIVLNESIDSESIYGRFELQRTFNIKHAHFYNKRDISYKETYKEERFHYDTRFFKKVRDYMNFEGYFQTEKYFAHCKDVVRDEFVFRDSIQEQAKKFLEPVADKIKVSIHVRRGDYVPQPNYHPVCTLDYYKEAINSFPSDVQFVVISDDIEWCKEHLPVSNAIYSNFDTGIDMCVMSMCNHNIIANSTFSWWGAWLNSYEHKKVIAPKIWFGPYYQHYDLKDLYCEGWNIL
jgi:hypothetical protein